MVKGNHMISNGHFHKYWQRHIRTWFNQPARKFRRRQNRIKKAKSVFPRPAKGPIRPIVHCPSQRYNTKIRAGRGFTLAELKGAGLSKNFAQTVGIAVDPRRQNKSVESRQENVQRLKEYRSKLILFPVHRNKKPRKGEATPDECKMAKQLKRSVMPIRNARPKVTLEPITEEQKKFSAYQALHQARLTARFFGVRAKKAREAAENESNQPGGGGDKKGKK
ncbi:60S ribosomal protein L13 [Anopheles marshallii]|uniref:60S ribosomal protein L13 n=1 Tax=Anopheles marshallii TaxID=1521116 RepID=UPI00237A7B41|nr:60S ribosomal protein L13 [Anopheles marshallii]